MNIFWPGLIVGLLLMALCVIGYTKRDALGKAFTKGTSDFIGEKATAKLNPTPEQVQANLMIPLFGGIALGGAIVIFSLTGVMR